MKFQHKLINKLSNIFKERKSGLEFLLYNVSGNIFTFLLNLILPFYLDIDGYGYFALVFSIFNVGAAFFTFGLDSTIIKLSVESDTSDNVLKKCLISWVIMSGFFFIILLLALYFLSENVLIKIAFSSLIIIIIASVFTSIVRVFLSYYIGVESIKRYGIVFVLNKFTQFLIIMLIAIFTSREVFIDILPYLLILQSFLIVIMILFLERKDLLYRTVKLYDVFKTIKFTLPLSVNTFGNLGYSYGFNVLISPFLSLSQLGVLNIFNQLFSMSSMTINALNNGYIPRFYREYKHIKKNAIVDYFKYILINSIPIIFVVFGIGIGYKYLRFNNNDDYTIFSLAIYCLGIFLYSFKSVGNNILILEGKTVKISMLTITTSLLNIFMGIFLTKAYGFIGCILGVFLGYVIQSIAFNMASLRQILYFVYNRNNKY